MNYEKDKMTQLNKKESKKFVKQMIKTEKRKPTEQEIETAKRIKRFENMVEGYYTDTQKFILDYLKFKEDCVEYKIFDTDEIIKLFEVFITSFE